MHFQQFSGVSEKLKAIDKSFRMKSAIQPLLYFHFYTCCRRQALAPQEYAADFPKTAICTPLGLEWPLRKLWGIGETLQLVQGFIDYTAKIVVVFRSKVNRFLGIVHHQSDETRPTRPCMPEYTGHRHTR